MVLTTWSTFHVESSGKYFRFYVNNFVNITHVRLQTTYTLKFGSLSVIALLITNGSHFHIYMDNELPFSPCCLSNLRYRLPKPVKTIPFSEPLQTKVFYSQPQHGIFFFCYYMCLHTYDKDPLNRYIHFSLSSIALVK